MTPEQAAASAALEEAILRVVRAYDTDESVVGVVNDWIVVAAETKPDLYDATNDVTAYSVLMAGGGLPWHRAAGLLRAGMQHLGPAYVLDEG